MNWLKNSGLLTALIIGGFFCFLYWGSYIFEGLENWAYDNFLIGQLYEKSQEEPRIVVLEDDNITFDSWNNDPEHKALKDYYGGYDSYRRMLLAQVIRILTEKGVKVIGLDMLLEDSKHNQCDEALAQAMKETDNVILAVSTTVQKGAASINPPAEKIRQAAKGVGLIDIKQEDDGIIRKYYNARFVNRQIVPSFAVALMEAYRDKRYHVSNIFEGDEKRQDRESQSPDSYFIDNISLPQEGDFFITFRGEKVKNMGLWTILSESFEESMALRPDYFKDAIVLIGTTQPADQDFFSSPLNQSRVNPGVYFHANALATIFDYESEGKFLKKVGIGHTFGIFFALAILGNFIFRRLKPLGGTAFLMALIWLMGYISRQLMLSYVWFDFSAPSLLIFTIFVADVGGKFIMERREKNKIKGAFTNYVNPTLVSEILRDPTKLRLGGEKREMTVLFSDVAGFTTISEMLSPEELVGLLNEYLNDMTELVLESDGLLDKFIGDAVMAVWGAPLPLTDHAQRGVETAIKMLEKLAILQKKWKAEGWPDIDIRIGLNTGQMVAGNMGCERRKDYTVIGDAVNLASRLEGINKQYGTRITISEFTLAAIGDKFITRQTDCVKVKGKNEPVKIFEVLGRSGEIPQEKLEQIKVFSEGMNLYLAQKWEEAQDSFQRANQMDPEDHCPLLYLDRVKQFMENPPGQDWDGVFTMMTK